MSSTCVATFRRGAQLRVDGALFTASVSPYSPGCHLRGRLIAVATVDELEAVEARSSVLLARGELTKEPLMPKNFPFYNPDGHNVLGTIFVRGTRGGELRMQSETQ